MSVFKQIAKAIANIEYPPEDGLREREKKRSGIPVWDLPSIMDSRGIHEINLYPSESEDPCHNQAVFISLNGRLKGRGRHLSFEKALHKIVQHFDHGCDKQTKLIGLITDECIAKIFDQWRPSIERIVNSGVTMETYLIAPRVVSRIDWP